MSVTTAVENTNHQLSYNNNQIGIRYDNAIPFNGYMAEIHYVNGQALAPTDFGKYNNNNVWQPKEYTGTYGATGYYLDFSDNSSTSALGTDSSGNSNDWTANNFSVPTFGTASSTETTRYVVTPVNAQLNSSNTYYYQKAFDGNDSTSGYLEGVDFEDYETYSKPVCSDSAGGIEVNAGGAGALASYNDESAVTLAASGWTKISGNFNGTVDKIRVGTTNQFPVSAYIKGIRINGVEFSVVEVDTATSDSMFDSPTNYETSSGNNRGNYCTWNLLDKDPDVTVSNGNLDFSQNNPGVVRGTIAVTSGKWYWEITKGGSNAYQAFGISSATVPVSTFVGGFTGSAGLYGTGYLYTQNGDTEFTKTSSAQITTLAADDVIGIALDLDSATKTVKWYKNGALLTTGHVEITSTDPITPCMGTNIADSGVCNANFGQRPFEYKPPSGHLSLCTANLPDPTIEDGSTAMDVSLWTGNGTSRTISGLGFSPDFVWIKQRDGTRFHVLYDTVRGATNAVHSNTDAVEFTDGATLTTFNTDGFEVGSQALVNENAKTYAAWSWDAGTSDATNTDGSLTSTVRANPTAGFSVVKYTGNGTAGSTIGHGLNSAPHLILVKNLDTQVVWVCYHKVVGPTQYTVLSTNAAPATASGPWNNTEPTSSVFSVGNSTASNNNGDEHIAYCWAPVEGYSAFGEFTGNGTADNAFVYTGFRPRYVVWKRTDSTGNWGIHDTKREPYNHTGDYILTDTAAVEVAFDAADFVSNGFKMINSAYVNNATYMWWAFAEHPFKTARAR